MTRSAVLLAAAVTAAPVAALAESPPRVALVMGNATYPGLPALPGCTASAGVMADAFAKLGFDVLRLQDASNGDAGAQLTRFDAGLRAGPAPVAAVYLCGYARALDGRGYLLPVDARIDRPTDLLAQGVLPQTFLRVAAEAGAKSGLLLMDAFDVPGQASAAAAHLADPARPGFGIAVAGHAAPTDAATPLAITAAAALDAPGADAGAVVTAIYAKLGAAAIVAAPSAPAPLSPPPAPPPAPPPPAAPAPLPPPPDPATEDGRRAVQQSLTQLGYYAGAVDGVFGPDSKAAIRRLQHELGDPMTGTLTAPEITALQARAR